MRRNKRAYPADDRQAQDDDPTHSMLANSSDREDRRT
jgi:hypothetical protein